MIIIDVIINIIIMIEILVVELIDGDLYFIVIHKKL